MTASLTSDSRSLAGLEAVSATAPRVYALLAHAWAAAPEVVDPALLDLVHARVNFLLGLTAEDVEGTSDVLALTDQFVKYVPDVREEHLVPLREQLGRRGLRALVDALYILDQTARLRITHARLFAAGEFEGSTPGVAGEGMSLGRTNAAFHHQIMLLPALDPTTREIIRLRAASYHHCRLCMSGRVVSDGHVLVDESLAAQIDNYLEQPLSPPHQAALRYVDAHMIEPTRVDDELAAELRAHFTPAQIVEISLAVTAFNYQKILVALSLDLPVNAAGLVAFSFDEQGDLVVGDLL